MDFNDAPKNGEILPFGKYKGQPVEVLAQDREYADWLMSQDWFRSKFPAIQTLIVNNFAQPSNTPDHNELQARFLDDEFCKKLMDLVDPGWSNTLYEEISKTFSARRKELLKTKKWLEDEVQRKESTSPYWVEIQEKYKRESQVLEGVIASFPGDACYEFVNVEFEVKGADVELVCGVSSINELPSTSSKLGYKLADTTQKYRLELKPQVSDDYPAVLRQMKASRCEVLVTRQYTGIGATEDQFRQIFNRSGIRVFTEDQIDNWCRSF